jgi:hypothetical protein
MVLSHAASVPPELAEGSATNSVDALKAAQALGAFHSDRPSTGEGPMPLSDCGTRR